MTRLPRPNSKTERIARRRVLSYMWAATKQDLYREPYRQRLMDLDHGAPLTASDMRPVWKARRERRRLGRERHAEACIKHAVQYANLVAFCHPDDFPAVRRALERQSGVKIKPWRLPGIAMVPRGIVKL